MRLFYSFVYLLFFLPLNVEAAVNQCRLAFFDSAPLIESADFKNEFAMWTSEMVTLQRKNRPLSSEELDFVRTAFGHQELSENETNEFYRIQSSKMNAMIRRTLQGAFEEKYQRVPAIASEDMLKRIDEIVGSNADRPFYDPLATGEKVKIIGTSRSTELYYRNVTLMANFAVEAYFINPLVPLTADEFAVLLAARKYSGEARQIKNAVYGKLSREDQRKMEAFDKIAADLIGLISNTSFGGPAQLYALARLEIEEIYPRSKMGCCGHACGKACGLVMNSVGAGGLGGVKPDGIDLKLFRAAIKFYPYVDPMYADMPLYEWAAQFQKAR